MVEVKGEMSLIKSITWRNTVAAARLAEVKRSLLAEQG
jgi:hypothetical protein